MKVFAPHGRPDNKLAVDGVVLLKLAVDQAAPQLLEVGAAHDGVKVDSLVLRRSRGRAEGAGGKRVSTAGARKGEVKDRKSRLPRPASSSRRTLMKVASLRRERNTRSTSVGPVHGDRTLSGYS